MLKQKLLDTNWTTILGKNGDDAASAFVDEILRAVAATIPSRIITEKVFAHLWLDNASRLALVRKRWAFGTPLFELRRDECTRAFL